MTTYSRPKTPLMRNYYETGGEVAPAAATATPRIAGSSRDLAQSWTTTPDGTFVNNYRLPWGAVAMPGLHRPLAAAPAATTEPAVEQTPFTPHTETGIPTRQQNLDSITGGHAAPAIHRYLQGPLAGSGPQLSYRPDAHSAWLGQVAENAEVGAQNIAAEGAAHERNRASFEDPNRQAAVDAGWRPYSSALSPSEYLEASPETRYDNTLNVGGGGAQAGGIWSSIRGHGDDAGSSLATGSQSNVGLQDHAIALGERVPGFIGAGTRALNDRFNIAPRDPNQRDARTAQEVSIARHTQNWAEQAPDTPITQSEYTGRTIDTVTNNDNDDHFLSHEEILERHGHRNPLQNANQGPGATFDQTPEESAAAAGFDMNDPSTWASSTDSRERNNDNNDDGGSSDSGGGK